MIIIWDLEAPPPYFNETVILWSGFSDQSDKKIISVPQYVEDNAEELKNRYLAWIYDLGETLIGKTRVIDHLQIRPGFSYWWMLPLTEKSVFKSPQLTTAIKLLAFEELIKSYQENKLILFTSDKKLASILGKWCKIKNIVFEKKVKNNKKVSLKIKKLLPVHFHALFFLLRLLFLRFSLRHNNIFKNTEAKITFIDYFANFGVGAVERKKFSSNYWKILVETVREMKLKTNWVHFFPSDKNGANHEMKLALNFTEKSSNLESHKIINGKVTISMLPQVFVDFFCLVQKKIKINKISKHFTPKDSALDFWPIFRNDWYNSFCGITAIKNSLTLKWVELSILELPKQSIGFYLQENHSWELALNYYWRKSGHGTLFGVVHSTVRFWDLRYFFDKRTYYTNSLNALPRPNKVAINGEVSKKAYLSGNYPSSELVEVEAIRYQYLSYKHTSNLKADESAFKLLVCGDIMPNETKVMMKLIEKAASKLPPGISIEVKPHPLCKINPSDYPNINFTIINNPLEEILYKYNLVFTSNSTSAAVDAYCFGIPVIQMLDGNSLNMSPLRNLDDVIYITDDVTLARAINNLNIENYTLSKSYFYLNKDLPNWKKILTQTKFY